jgi:hypothetical protein
MYAENMNEALMLNKIPSRFQKMIDESLRDGEALKVVASGFFRKPTVDKTDSFMAGILLVTDQRVIRMFKLWWNESVQGIPISKISSVGTDKGMLGIVTINVTTANEEMDFRVNKAFAPALVDAIEEQRRMSGGSGTETGQILDPISQIEKLAALHSKGILSDEEFADKKAELLKQI